MGAYNVWATDDTNNMEQSVITRDAYTVCGLQTIQTIWNNRSSLGMRIQCVVYSNQSSQTEQEMDTTLLSWTMCVYSTPFGTLFLA